MILANSSFDNTHLGLNEELVMGDVVDVYMPTLFIRIPAWSDVLIITTAAIFKQKKRASNFYKA